MAGVPQGGVLSPLLFNVIMSDIPNYESINLYIFADDITISCMGPDATHVENKLQRYIDKLQEWFNRWKFSVNVNKTKWHFFTRKKIQAPKLKCNGNEIETVKKQKLLGVTFDAPRLTLTAHIRNTTTDCIRRLNIMKTLSSPRYGMTHRSLKKFYEAYIRSKLLYCPSILIDVNNTQKAKLNVVQNSTLRFMLGARRTTPVLSLQAESNTAPVENHINYMFCKYLMRLKYRPANDLIAKVCSKLVIGVLPGMTHKLLADCSVHKLVHCPNGIFNEYIKCDIFTKKHYQRNRI